MHSTKTDAVSKKQLRSFAFIFTTVFAIIAFWPTIFDGEAPRTWALIVAAIWLVWGLLHPASLRKPYLAWMAFGGFVGKVNSKIILFVVFFVLVTPIRFVMSLFGYDAMHRKLDDKAETYREKRERRPASHMSRQF